jgi:hypothetical protein
MNKKAAITFMEIILLAISSSAFIITYTLFAESSKQTILLEVVNHEKIEECSAMLMSLYRNDYIRSEGGYLEIGSFADLSEYYGGLPIEYANPNRAALLAYYSDKSIYEGSLTGDCSISIFNPYEVFRGGRPFRYVSVS